MSSHVFSPALTRYCYYEERSTAGARENVYRREKQPPVYLDFGKIRAGQYAYSWQTGSIRIRLN